MLLIEAKTGKNNVFFNLKKKIVIENKKKDGSNLSCGIGRLTLRSVLQLLDLTIENVEKTLVHLADMSVFDVVEDDIEDVKENNDNKGTPSDPSSSPKPTSTIEEVNAEN
ncbi:hypothetical protein V8G54_022041 [Vigna mungo]|uniref:Uncharacterized protein n=1 Tax=Vigna mungo TaxID=3915 RepID=A0AAQ3NGT9_VIGMU